MRLLIIALLGLHLLAMAVFEKCTRGIGPERIVYNLVLNVIAFFTLFSLCCSDGDTLGKLAEFFRMECSYQDVARLSLFLLLHVLLAWPMAILFRRLTNPGKNDRVRIPALLLVLTLLLSTVGIEFTFSGVKKLKITEIVAGEEGSVIVQNTGELAVDLEKAAVCGVSLDGELLPGGTYTVSLNVPKQGGIVTLNYGTRRIDTISTPDLKDGDRYRCEEDVWTLNTGIHRPKAPVLSVRAGCYEEPFNLKLSAEQGCRIYYTLDGSAPDMNGTRYTVPIEIYDRSGEVDVYRNYRDVTSDYINKEFTQSISPKATVVRAIAIDEDDQASETITATYLVGINEQLPIISLVMDPDDLFGDNGMYVTGDDYDEWYLSSFQKKAVGDEPLPNFMKEGEEWTRPASFEMFENGELSWTMDVSASIYGINSRNYGRKEFRLTGLDGDYLLQYGEDTFIAQRLAAGRSVTTPSFLRAILYLNGEQWENICLCRELDSANMGGVTVNNGMADSTEVQEDYERLFELADDYDSFAEIADVQSYIDESCLRAYLADIDHKERWRSFVWKPDGGKWTWGLYDLSFGWNQLREDFAVEYAWEIDPFTMYGKYQDVPVSEWTIFQKLCTDDRFVRGYALSMMDLINTNLNQENTKRVLQEMGIYEQEYVDFFAKRAPYAIRYTAQALGLSGETGTIDIVSERGSGSVQVNSVEPEMTNGRFQGEYYVEYPVELSAQGEGFHLWRVVQNDKVEEYTDRQIEISVNGGVTVEAVFE